MAFLLVLIASATSLMVSSASGAPETRAEIAALIALLIFVDDQVVPACVFASSILTAASMPVFSSLRAPTSEALCVVVRVPRSPI